MTAIEVMQQALEALYLRRNQGVSEAYNQMAEEAIANLRTAIEQVEKVEPVAWWASMWELGKGPNPFHTCKLCGETEPGLVEYLQAHSNKHITHSAPTIPEGWQLVPFEPTDAMIDAGGFEGSCFRSVYRVGCKVWSDMLAAAPTPEEL